MDFVEQGRSYHVVIGTNLPISTHTHKQHTAINRTHRDARFTIINTLRNARHTPKIRVLFQKCARGEYNSANNAKKRCGTTFYKTFGKIFFQEVVCVAPKEGVSHQLALLKFYNIFAFECFRYTSNHK